ncbi:AraC family transcriptional regulator [Marinobacter sp. BW6]|nr:AraC family transcriptional regulator [Marinobacter sp. BW6]
MRIHDSEAISFRPKVNAHAIAGIARECGFQHMSQFSLDYKRQFRESPSDTLRQSRAGEGSPVR